MLELAKRYTLESIVFFCGAGVMILELTATRVLAPYVGTSLFVWTNLIGVILGSLALGYAWGGRLADRRPGYGTLAWAIFAGGAAIGGATVAKDVVMLLIQATIRDVRIGSLLGTLVLFALPSVLLGMVSPLAAKIRLGDLSTSGSTVGRLYAISTLGSIVGTFVAGFFLVPYFGHTSIFYGLSGALIILSALAAGTGLTARHLLFLFFVLTAGIATVSFKANLAERGFWDIDTLYNRVFITRGVDTPTGRPAQYLIMNAGQVESAMFLDRDDGLVLPYAKLYRLSDHFVPDMKRALMLGGAAYSYPKYFLAHHPGATMDVIEIDPGLTRIAEEHFGLRRDERLAIYHEDARTFINGTQNRYDVVFGDAFRSSHAIPHHLTTRETMEKIRGLLTKDGVLFVNLIASIEGDGGKVLRAEHRTLSSVFPRVETFLVHFPNDPKRLQNIILVAFNSDRDVEFHSADPELNEYLSRRWTGPVPTDLPILTDDHAPIDQYVLSTLSH